MERGIQQGAMAVMEMGSTAQAQSAFTEITLGVILSRENLAQVLRRVGVVDGG